MIFLQDVVDLTAQSANFVMRHPIAGIALEIDVFAISPNADEIASVAHLLTTPYLFDPLQQPCISVKSSLPELDVLRPPPLQAYPLKVVGATLIPSSFSRNCEAAFVSLYRGRAAACATEGKLLDGTALM
jgi:hypothetical protein